jgi:hypothetical protein
MLTPVGLVSQAVLPVRQAPGGPGTPLCQSASNWLERTRTHRSAVEQARPQRVRC